MKKTILIITGIVIAGIIVYRISSLSTGSDDMTTLQATNGEKEQITIPAAGSSGLIEYSNQALLQSKTQTNLIFFHAGWCSICNSVKERLESSAIPDTMSIFIVDYDSNEGKDLARKYGLRVQYTTVQVDTSGNEITKWINNYGDGVPEFTRKLEEVDSSNS